MAGKGKILIVDDEYEIRQLLHDILSEEGYDCAEVGDGEMALKRIDEEAFDLVILDIIMPRVNGLEVLQVVKQKHPKTRVIMLSAIGRYNKDFFDVVIGDGTVEALMDKPIKIAQFLEVVEKAVTKQ